VVKVAIIGTTTGVAVPKEITSVFIARAMAILIAIATPRLSIASLLHS
jgi:hypothetical protein